VPSRSRTCAAMRHDTRNTTDPLGENRVWSAR
jgi:hypothetical protein